ncbi:MAG: type II secretion system F family protein [Acidobacteria bacterium]|nr:type II secretion system F family protein [Acidobacteriota bacterium]
MVWAAAGIAFAATALIVMAVMYAFNQGGVPVQERLAGLWRPAQPQRKLGEKIRIQRSLSSLGKLISSSPKQLERQQRLMVRAGFRRSEAALVFMGTKILLAGGLLALVYFTGFYRQNPVFILPFALALGYVGPDFWLTQRIRKRQQTLRLSLADALDLLVVCVEAGLGLDLALLRVSQELKIAHPELCAELDIVNAELRVGTNRTEALRGFATRTGVDDIKALVAMLIQTDRFGTSIAQSLRVHSEELRTKRRQRAQEEAAKTTVKMVPPLVFFIFPALFAVILGPAVISVARNMLPIFVK